MGRRGSRLEEASPPASVGCVAAGPHRARSPRPGATAPLRQASESQYRSAKKNDASPPCSPPRRGIPVCGAARIPKIGLGRRHGRPLGEMPLTVSNSATKQTNGQRRRDNADVDWGLEVSRVGVLGVVAGSLLTLGANCTPKPKILTPANETQIDAAGTPVSIDLVGDPGPSAIVSVQLFRAVDEAPVTSIDVTSLLTRAGASMTGNLAPAELREGRNRLLVTIDSDGDGAVDNQSWSTFSWEPNLDLANADRCDPLDPTYCLYPVPERPLHDRRRHARRPASACTSTCASMPQQRRQQARRTRQVERARRLQRRPDDALPGHRDGSRADRRAADHRHRPLARAGFADRAGRRGRRANSSCSGPSATSTTTSPTNSVR